MYIYIYIYIHMGNHPKWPCDKSYSQVVELLQFSQIICVDLC